MCPRRHYMPRRVMNSKMWAVVGALLVAACQRQSSATFESVHYDERVGYILTNIIVGLPREGGQPPFLLETAPTDVSGSTVDRTGETVTFPNARFAATFDDATRNTIAFVQLLQTGATLCAGELFFGSQIPVACTTPTFARVMCTDTCRYPAIRNGEPILAVANAHVHVDGCDDEIDILLISGGVVRVCSRQNMFNPLAMGASIHHFTASEQVIFFPQHIDDGPVAAVFVVALILALVVWVGNAPVILFQPPNDNKVQTLAQAVHVPADVATAALHSQNGNVSLATAWIQQTSRDDHSALAEQLKYSHSPERIQTITMAVSDLAITAVSTSIVTLMDAADVYVPPETTIATRTQGVWLTIYIVVMLIGSSLALATGTIHYLQSGRRGIAVLMRASLEITLLAAVFFHLPPTMGATFRRTIGFFLGATTFVIVARDAPQSGTAWTTTFQYIVTGVWAASAVLNATATMILPAFYQSAGVQNKAANAVAIATAVAVMAVTRLAVGEMTRREKIATPPPRTPS